MRQNFGESDPWGRPMGILVVDIDQGMHQEPLLGGLLVDNEQRRKGLATRLILRAETYLKEQAFKRVFAVTHPNNEAANKLFEKLGYSRMILWEKKL